MVILLQWIFVELWSVSETQCNTIDDTHWLKKYSLMQLRVNTALHFSVWKFTRKASSQKSWRSGGNFALLKKVWPRKITKCRLNPMSRSIWLPVKSSCLLLDFLFFSPDFLLNSLKQSICSHRTNINQSRQTLFYLVNVWVWKKIQQKSSELFLSSSFPANEWRLSRPLCPISPQRERERLGPLLDQICSICQCYYRNWPASRAQTITNTHTYTQKHTNNILSCIFTHQQHLFLCHHHQSGSVGPQGGCGAALVIW